MQRGDIVNGPPAKVGTYAPTDLLALLGGNDLGKTLLQLAYTPLCTVTVYHLEYETVDPAQNLTVASGALMIPSGTDSRCTGARSIVLYAHGTTTDRNYDISQFAATGNGEAMVLAAVFAAEGYIVVAPNEVGYDVSTLDYHPYLIAGQQSEDMIDALTAARAALPTAEVPGTVDIGKLFITGYSEGGYVAMATHKAMEAAGMTVTASGPMSGPYAMSAFSDAIFEGQTNNSAAKSLALVMVAYQKAYGDIYSTRSMPSPPSTPPPSRAFCPVRSPSARFSRKAYFLPPHLTSFRPHQPMRSTPRRYCRQTSPAYLLRASAPITWCPTRSVMPI